MPPSRRLWDSSVVIGYLAGYEDLKSDCLQIISQAQNGEVEIVVSALATVEAAYLAGHSESDSEARIREFFSRHYIVPVAIDAPVAARARELIRKHRSSPKLKPPDAVHLATAVQLGIPVVETTDADFLRFNRVEGNPLVVVRRPLYEGSQRLTGI